ncbi:hypothetical protein [Mucilaginibacter terrenus]|nr:hypothetical protein [Mucilaginibacter terrenus]
MNDNQVLLTLADSDKGPGKEFDIDKASPLGMERIKALCKPVGGKLRIKNNGGAAISIVINLETAADEAAAHDLFT